jgi:hypothetical protein
MQYAFKFGKFSENKMLIIYMIFTPCLLIPSTNALYGDPGAHHRTWTRNPKTEQSSEHGSSPRRNFLSPKILDNASKFLFIIVITVV